MKQCNGTDKIHSDRLSTAYCEGLGHRINTNGATIGENPMTATDAVSAGFWDDGWSAGQSASGGKLPTGVGECCAVDRNKVIVP